MNIEPQSMRTLTFGPLWVLSALSGTSNRFPTYELSAFWDTIVAVALRTPEPARGILTAMARDRAGLLAEFADDERPIVSGLRDVVAVLDRLDSAISDPYLLALLRIGAALGRSRGPFGRKILPEHEQLLLLIGELLEVDAAPSIQEAPSV